MKKANNEEENERKINYKINQKENEATNIRPQNMRKKFVIDGEKCQN